jgi:hypothetical protein
MKPNFHWFHGVYLFVVVLNSGGYSSHTIPSWHWLMAWQRLLQSGGIIIGRHAYHAQRHGLRGIDYNKASPIGYRLDHHCGETHTEYDIIELAESGSRLFEGIDRIVNRLNKAA